MVLRNRQLIIDYQNVFGSPEGKRVLQDLRKKTAFDSPVAARDGIALALNAGAVNVVKHIYRRMHLDPEADHAVPTFQPSSVQTGE